MTWQDGSLSRARRWRALAARGATVWLTGLPCSGKTTVGAALEQLLVERGVQAYLLDGDNLRHGICGDLGFSRQDREANVLRVGEVARLFADSGTVAIVALISPYETARAQVRERHERDGLGFYEIFVNTPLELCAERDTKGLYARAAAGEINGLTGVDDPYEPPLVPDLELTPRSGVGEAAQAVLELIEETSVSNGAVRLPAQDRQEAPTR